MYRTILALAVILCAHTAQADIAARDGWAVTPTTKSYETLIDDVKKAAKAHKMGVVTQAGPTGAAANRGITIPGNRVIGLFNNLYAVEVLGLSTAAMIEAPIRVYVTENDDETATLSYKLPSTVFAPYMAEAGAELGRIAGELDDIFANISAQATQ